MADGAVTHEEVSFSGAGRELRGLWTAAPDAVAAAVVAHGAGAGMQHPLIAAIAEGLAAERVSVLRFDFPYMQDGRRYADRPPVLIEAWRGALAFAAQTATGLPLVASGKSLGGRMASMMAAKDGDGFPARGIVLFGYPLHAPGKRDQPRDQHLASITVPMLFIQGTADPLAEIASMQAVVGRLGPLARIHVVEGGDHSFRVRGRKRPDPEIGRELGGIAASFVNGIVG